MRIEHDKHRTSKLSDSEHMIYSTTKITAYKGESLVSSGTGFFYGVQNNNGDQAPLLITNKHVIDSCDNIKIHVHLADSKDNSKPSRETIEWHIPIGGHVIRHSDDAIDLCAVPVANLLEHVTENKRRLFIASMRKNNIPDELHWNSFSPIEQVKMIGCPKGLYDEFNHLPLARQGITATPIYNSYMNKPEFLVDIACFPGSSGSPVFIHNDGVFLDIISNEARFGDSRLLLVGILYAGPLIDNRGQITFGQPQDFSVATGMHLGNVIRSDQLLWFDDYLHNQLL